MTLSSLIIPPWVKLAASVAVVAVIFYGGYVVGDAMRSKELIAYRDAEIQRLKEVNGTQSKTIEVMGKIDELRRERENTLREELAEHARKRVRERDLFREKQYEENAACRAWLDAVNPCRLRPQSAEDRGSGGETP